jgi:hypothetical protein
MIKKFWQITIRDYDIIEKTGVVSHLKSPWNFLPVIIFVKPIAKELKILSEKLNNRGLNDDVLRFENLKWQVESLNKINAIRTSFLGITNILELSSQLKSLTENKSRSIRRKIKFKGANLAIYIENIKFYTGIEIVCLDDIQKVNDNLQFRIDKYNDMMSKQSEEADGKVYLMSVALGVFTFLNQTLNVHLTVMEFITARDKAVEDSQKMQEKQEEWQK